MSPEYFWMGVGLVLAFLAILEMKIAYEDAKLRRLKEVLYHLRMAGIFSFTLWFLMTAVIVKYSRSVERAIHARMIHAELVFEPADKIASTYDSDGAVLTTPRGTTIKLRGGDHNAGLHELLGSGGRGGGTFGFRSRSMGTGERFGEFQSTATAAGGDERTEL